MSYLEDNFGLKSDLPFQAAPQDHDVDDDETIIGVSALLPSSDYAAPMRGELHGVATVERFMFAGDAILTFISKKTGKRFTFRFTRPESESGRSRPTWVKVLSGPNNDSDYNFLGTIWDGAQGRSYRHSSKSRVGQDSDSVRAVQWLLKALNVGDFTPGTGARSKLDLCTVHHEGRCGRCGRRLTVPSSVASGFGPECVQHV